MNAEQYYERNVLLHGMDKPRLEARDFDRLPAVPSELDYALCWLRGEGITGRIIDVGCAGLTLLRSAKTLFTSRHGIDIVTLPIWDDYPEIQTQVCNLDNAPLPYADDSFDAVTCLMVLEHVFDPFHAVRELRRVCRREGRIVISVPNIAGLKRRFEILLGKLPITSARFSFGEDSWDGYHLHNFTRATLHWLLRKEGLEVMRWAAQGKRPWLKQWRPSLFGNDLIVLARKVEPEPKRPFPE